MGNYKDSDCWYRKKCTDDCNGCITYKEMKYQMMNSGLPIALQRPIDLYLTNRVDNDAFVELSNIRHDIVNQVNNGLNLYICSSQSGNGKTSWAVKMLHTYFHYTSSGNYDNLKGMFVSVTDLLIKLKDFNHPMPHSYRQAMESVDLLVFDDIATSGLTQYDYTQLYSIINNRLMANKSNIYTSNITQLYDLEDVMGQRLASRVYTQSRVIELKGRDVRNG